MISRLLRGILILLFLLCTISHEGFALPVDEHYPAFLTELGASEGDVAQQSYEAYKALSSGVIDNGEIVATFGGKHRAIWGHSLDWYAGTEAERRRIQEQLLSKGWSPERIGAYFEAHWPPKEDMHVAVKKALPQLSDEEARVFYDYGFVSHLAGDVATPEGIPIPEASWKRLKEWQEGLPDADKLGLKNKLATIRIMEEKGCDFDEAFELFWRSRGGADKTVAVRLLRRLGGSRLVSGPEKVLVIALPDGARYILACGSQDDARRTIRMVKERRLSGRIVVDDEVYDVLRRSGDDTIRTAIGSRRVVSHADAFGGTLKGVRTAEQLRQAKAVGRQAGKVASRLSNEALGFLGKAGRYVDVLGVVTDAAYLAYYSYRFAEAMKDPYAAQLDRARYGVQTGVSAATLGTGIVLILWGPPGWAALAIAGGLAVCQVGTDYMFDCLSQDEMDRFHEAQWAQVRDAVDRRIDESRQAIEAFRVAPEH